MRSAAFMPGLSHFFGHLLAFWPWLAAALSGVFLACGYAPFDQAWLAWIGLAPLQAALWLRPRGPRARLVDLALGFVTGAGFFWIVFSWLQNVTVGGWFILCLYLALYPALWAWIAGPLPHRLGRWLRGGWMKKRALATAAGTPTPEPFLPFLSSRVNLAIAFVAASAWVTTEWLRGHVMGGFGWNTLATASHDILGMIQIAAIGGAPALSWVMAFCGTIATLTVIRFVLEVGRTKIRPHFDFTITMALVGACFVYGVRTLQQTAESTPLRIAMVQPNIPQAIKWDHAYADQILAKLIKDTRSAQGWGPDLTLWPEAATPHPFFNHGPTLHAIRNLAESMTGGLLFGSLQFTFGPQQEPQDYNVAIFFEDSKADLQVYRKLHLVPFGEYVPFRNEIPLIDRIVGDRVAGDFRSGDDPVILRFQDKPIRMAPLICFEDTLARVTRRFLEGENSANLLVNITNDAWFKQSAASRQHLANARLRTVEFRRPMLRCANTGVTCTIDAGGRIRQLHQSETGDTFIDGVLLGVVDVPIAPEPTPFFLYGDWVSMSSITISSAWIMTGLITGFLRRRKRKDSAETPLSTPSPATSDSSPTKH